jgi:glycosyltransferase involved in cell wall biosynthesis
MSSTKKPILMMHYGGSSIRGSEICFIEAARALATAGYRLIVLRNDPVIDDFLRPWANALIPFDYPELMIEGSRTRLPLIRFSRALSYLYRVVNRWPPVLIYTNGGLPCQLAVPTARIGGVPVLCHFHHPGIRRMYYIWLVKFADHLIFPSKYTRNHSLLKANCTGDVVYNGVDTDLFRPLSFTQNRLRHRLGLQPGRIVVGQVGALERYKRPELLIRAFSKAVLEMPKLHLCLIGQGPIEKDLLSLAEKLGLQDRVTITGFVPSVLPYYQQVIDIKVLASVQEGLGISVLEGSSCGLPALVADSTGLRETVIDGVTGFKFLPDDEPDLVRLMLRLARSRTLRHQLGNAGRAWVLEKFSLATYHQNIVAAVNKAIMSGGTQQF